MTTRKTVLFSTRIDPDLKENAERVFEALGLTMTDAIRMFLTRTVAEQGLPISTAVPNQTTRKALADVDAGRGIKRHKNTSELFAHLHQSSKIAPGRK